MKSWILTLVMGTAMMVSGGGIVYVELRTPPVHNAHLYVGVGLALLGALMVNPTPILSGVRQVVVIIAPIIPWSKVAQERRASGSVPKPPEGD